MLILHKNWKLFLSDFAPVSNFTNILSHSSEVIECSASDYLMILV